MKIKFILLLLLALQFNGTLLGKSSPNNTDSLKREVEHLYKKIEGIIEQQETQKEQINYQKELITSQTGMIDTGFDVVSGQIGSATYFIEIVAIILTILSVVAGIYLERLRRNVSAMSQESATLVQRNIQIKEETEMLSKMIKTDVKNTYKLIRNEESNHLLERLISVPEDITNLFSVMASRDLEDEHFPQMKEAFFQVENNDEDNKDRYLILFFQHFSGLSILDNDLNHIFLSKIHVGFAGAFKNDAVKSAGDFFNAIVKKEIQKSRNEINSYVKSLCKTKFSSNEAVYFAIINEMKSRELKFALYDTIDKIPETLDFRKMIGNLILDYKFENLNKQEEAIIQDIKTII